MIEYFLENLPLLAEKTLQHLILAGSSTLLAILIGVPLGILIRFKVKARGPVLMIAGVIQTIPSLALLALLMLPLGIGFKPAIIALTLYGLLPIIRNTYTGLQGVPKQTLEAARGLGFTDKQRLLMVELPLAMPVIVAGIRTATVINVGVATLSAYIGAGGLGDFIVRGMSMMNTNSIALGCASSALLALSLDFTIGLTEKLLRKRQHTKETDNA